MFITIIVLNEFVLKILSYNINKNIQQINIFITINLLVKYFFFHQKTYVNPHHIFLNEFVLMVLNYTIKIYI